MKKLERVAKMIHRREEIMKETVRYADERKRLRDKIMGGRRLMF